MRLCLVLRRYFLVFFFLLLLFASTTFAQTGTTSIRGTILEKTGGVVAGATVRLSSAALSVERTTTSRETGQYEFVALHPGIYVLTVEAPGFQKYEQRSIIPPPSM